MLTFRVTSDVRQAEHYLSDVQRKYAPSATVMALNRTARAVMTVARRETAKSIGLPAKEIKDKLDISQATRVRHVASVVVSKAGYRAMNLIKWKARQTKKGVRYRMHESKLLPGAFINTGRGGNLLVFKRTTPARYPIVSKTGPSVALGFNRETVQKAMDARGREVWSVEFGRALKRKLDTAR